MNRDSEPKVALPNPTRRVDWTIVLPAATSFVAFALYAFALYAFNLSSTVTYGGDCGELIAASYQLGIAHPTGYVLYVLLGKTFASLLPFGEIAWRYNVFSALCGALCIAVLTRLMLEIFARHDEKLHDEKLHDVKPRYRVLVVAQNRATTNSWPTLFAACVAGALLAGFYFFFSQCVLAEVYSLNALMLSLLLWCAWKWHDSFALQPTSSTRCEENLPDWRWLWTLGLLFGLSLNAHMSCVFALPALMLLCVWHRRKAFRGRAFSRLATLTFWTLCGFALTIYLPLRASLFPVPQGDLWWPLDWTHAADFSSWATHFRARQYEFLFLQPTRVELFGHATTIKWFVQPFSAIPPKMTTLIALLFAQWLWAFALVPVGAFVAWKRDRAFGGALLWVFAVNFAVQINYDVGVGELANFLFPAYIVMTLWIGFGLHALLGRLQRWSARRDEVAAQTSSTRCAAVSVKAGVWQWRARTISGLLLLATIGIQWQFATPVASMRGNTHAREAALERAVATEQLQSQTHRKVELWTASDDATWSFWYAQFALNRARGVATPWGTNWRRHLRENGATKLSTQAMQRGELAMSYYVPEVDARFPLVPFAENIAPRGIVWRASRRKLPLPATPNTSHIEYSKAAFRAILPMRDEDLAREKESAIARLKREDMTRLTLDFRAPWTTPIANSPIEKADSPPSIQLGWIQLLVAPRDMKVTNAIHQSVFSPLPDGQKISREMLVRRPRAPRASVQTLRLVVSQNARKSQNMRAVLPLQIDVENTGSYMLWVRLLRNRNDTTTPWTKAAPIEITAS